MMVKKHFLWMAALAAVLATAAGLRADVGWGSDPKQPSVGVEPIERVTLAAGRSAKVPVRFRLTKGFHVNSNLPKSDLLIPTVFTLKADSPHLAARVRYPKGEDIAFPFAPEEPLNVYTDEFTMIVDLKAAAAIGPGEYTVSGELKYQACNDRACFPPKSVPVEFKVAVEKAAKVATRR
ncbi:MAG: protein-disulfide reductase DsbD domain-containing protein [Terriglobales bacterium]